MSGRLRNRRPYREGRGQDGIALVGALWLVLILSVIAAGVLKMTIGQAGIASMEEERTHLRLAADGAIHAAIYDLTVTRDLKVAPEFAAKQFAGRFDTAVSMQTESGRININRASAGLISAAFAANGATENEALAIAAAILDWRDSDNLRRFRGAEYSDYRALDNDRLPRNGPFERVGEVGNVIGVTAAMRDCVAPALTVYSSSAEVAPSTAVKPVRSIFSWAAEHDWQDMEWALDDETPQSIINPYGTALDDVIRLTSTATSDRGIQVSVEAVVRLVRRQDRLFEVLSWREVFRASGTQHSCAGDST